MSDAVWNQLQADIKAQQQAKKKAADEERRLAQKVKEAEEQNLVAWGRAAELERAVAAAKAEVKKRIERELEEACRRAAEVKVARERAAAELKRKQKEAEENRKKALEIQQKLQCMGKTIGWIQMYGRGTLCNGWSARAVVVGCGNVFVSAKTESKIAKLLVHIEASMSESDEHPAVLLARASVRVCVSLRRNIYSSFPAASPVFPYRRASLSQRVQHECGVRAPVFMTRAEVSRHKQHSRFFIQIFARQTTMISYIQTYKHCLFRQC